MMYEIRNYHFRPDLFEPYKVWAKGEAMPYLATQMDVLVHLAGSLSPFGVCVRRQGVCPSRSSGMASPSWH